MSKQLRVVILGDYDNYLSYFTYGALEGFIRAGHLCRPVPFFGHPLGMIERQILWFKPHILVAHMLFGCSRYHKQQDVFEMLRGLRRRGIFVVYHNGDARRDPRYCGDISDIVDLGLLNQADTDHYEGIWKIPCIRWPYPCLYQENIAESGDIYKCELAFTGGLSASKDNVHAERTAFIGRLQDMGVKVKIFPTNETGNTRFQTAALAASANAVLGMQMERHLAGYLDVRPFQYMGAGALYFHDKCDQIREWFNPEQHYIEYNRDDPHSVEWHLNYYRHYPEKALKIRESGFRHCQQFHSAKQRAKLVIEKYEEMR